MKRPIVFSAVMLLVGSAPTVGAAELNRSQQAEGYVRRGVEARGRGDWVAAANCYLLALRVSPGLPAAKTGLEQTLRYLPAMKGGAAEVLIASFEYDGTLGGALQKIQGMVQEASYGRVALEVEYRADVPLGADTPLGSVSLNQLTVKDLLTHISGRSDTYARIEGTTVLVSSAVGSGPGGQAARGPASAPGGAASGEMLPWTNTSGKTLSAAFVGMDGSSVVLRTAAGRVFRYPLADLDNKGRAQAARLSGK